MSLRDEIAATVALLRHGRAGPAVEGARPSRVRVANDALAHEMLVVVASHFAATARALSAVRGEALGWARDYLRSPEFSAYEGAASVDDLRRLVETLPPVVRRLAPDPHALRPLLDDALASETAAARLRLPEPSQATLLFGLRGPLSIAAEAVTPSNLALARALRLAPHAALASYGRDVAALARSARAHSAAFLAPAEWASAVERVPSLFVRPGPYACAHVLVASGAVRTVRLGEACAAALAAGPVDPADPSLAGDLARLAAVRALVRALGPGRLRRRAF